MSNPKVQKYFAHLETPCAECGRILEYVVKTETPDGKGLVQLRCEECRTQGIFPYDIHLPLDLYRSEISLWFIAQMLAEVAQHPSGSESTLSCLAQLRFLPAGTGFEPEAYHQDRVKLILVTALFELLKNSQQSSLPQIRKFIYKDWSRLLL